MVRSTPGSRSQMLRRRTINFDTEGRIHLANRGGYAHSEEYALCDVEEILKGLAWHRSFPVEENYEIKNLPKFNDLTPYGIPEGKEYAAWTKEVERLARAADSQKPLLFEGRGSPWGPADKNGYANLHKLALQLQAALDICSLDTEVTLLESAPRLHHRSSYLRSHARLSMNFALEHDESHYEESLRVENHNTPYLHDLIDYITCVLLRIFQRSMKGDFWLHNCIRVLATLAAKLKTLGYNLTEAATTSLAQSTQSQQRLSKKGSEYLPKEFSMNRDGDGEKKGGEGDSRTSEEDIARSLPGKEYYLIMGFFNDSIIDMLLDAVNNLANGKVSKFSIDGFETSTLIYDDAGVHERLTLLYNERDGDIGATADPLVLESASVCLIVAFESWNSLAERYPETVGPVVDDRPHLELHWKKTRTEADGSLAHPESQDNSRGSLVVHEMHQVISLLVPYNLSCGQSPAHLHGFSTGVSFLARPQNPVRPFPQQRFLAAVAIRTSAYLNSRARLETDPEICTIAESVLAQKCLADGQITYNKFVTDQALRSKRAESRKDTRETLMKMKTWVIDEKSIIIPLRWYCWTMIGACLSLALGGVAIGFSVQTKIRGVDPSNITLFCWAVSGFFAFLAKELRVKNWRWRDFLQGRVVCCSVTEVCSTSNVKPQTFLAILLQLEHMMILSKRGPFHSAFTRKSDDGFSIDVPIETMTFIDGGLIPVKVQSTYGAALVFLRALRWGPGRPVTSQGVSKEGKSIVCRNMREPWELADDNMPRFSLCTNALQWHRIDGVYKRDARFL
ncbi:hypothetical protein BJX64DRAFT_84605 [Aspergillus heterothallicus]